MSRADEIKERLEAATPGPWELEVTGEQIYVGPQTGMSDPYDGALPLVANPVAELYPRKGMGTVADAELIARAPADIVYLLGLVRQAQQLVHEQVYIDSPHWAAWLAKMEGNFHVL